MQLRDGEMDAYLAVPDRTPAGPVIAIMEIWGVNNTMSHHAHEFADAGFVCLVPDLFWRQEPGVELLDKDPEHVKKAFDDGDVQASCQAGVKQGLHYPDYWKYRRIATVPSLGSAGRHAIPRLFAAVC
jgi:dienelactone hydrolase